MKQRIIFSGVILVFLALTLIVIKGSLREVSGFDVPVKSMDTWQQADAALGYPLNAGEKNKVTGKFAPPVLAPFDSRFIRLSAFELAKTPSALSMSAPMGSELGALTYNAQPFWELNKKRNGHHTGDDFNGIGGMNSDLRDPIYAVANGLAVYRGEPSPGWGNILILAHRTAQDNTLLSMYTHMDQIYTAIGSTVARGEVIGLVGTANDHYPAHLHLEMHDSSSIHIGAGYTYNADERINPTAIITSHQRTNHADLPSSVFAIVGKKSLDRRRRELRIKDRSSLKKKILSR